MTTTSVRQHRVHIPPRVRYALLCAATIALLYCAIAVAHGLLRAYGCGFVIWASYVALWQARHPEGARLQPHAHNAFAVMGLLPTVGVAFYMFLLFQAARLVIPGMGMLLLGVLTVVAWLNVCRQPSRRWQ